MPERTALGWRSHSGWAVAVVVSGLPSKPVVQWRDRVELIGPRVPRQPFHAAAERALSPSKAAELIGGVEEAACQQASSAIDWAVASFGVSAVGIAGGGRAIPSDLKRVLASHALLHAAEGDLYEQAIAAAGEAKGLPTFLTPPRDLVISTGIDGLGKQLGPPWQKDHKLATAAALVALGSR